MSTSGIGHDDEEGGIHDRRHDDRQIEVLQRVVGELADALQAEHHLGEQRRAADQRAEIEAEQRDESDQRGAQRMAQQDARFRQALGARRADVVFLQRLDDGGAQHAAVEADIEDRQRDPRDDQRQEPALRIVATGSCSPSGGTQENSQVS